MAAVGGPKKGGRAIREYGESTPPERAYEPGGFVSFLLGAIVGAGLITVGAILLELWAQ